MPSAIIFNPFVFPSLFFLISSTIPTTISTPDFVYKDCSNATFATNSSYQTNLNSVLTSLSSNSTTQSGFYNTTAGDGEASTIYGIFLCRGDDTEDVCRTCVATAVSAVPLYCPNSKQAIIWYDVCMIRYSNASFFGDLDESVIVYLSNVNNITNNATGFTSVLDDTMNKIALTAAKGQSGKKFATADVNFNVLQKVYTLAQCTPDLSSSDCYTCLTDCIGRLPSCCNGKQGGRVLFPSCNIRYEIALFYENTTAAPAPAPQVVAPPPAIGGNGKKSKVVIIVVVIAVISAVFVTLICCCLWRRRTKSWKKVKQPHDATPSEADVQITTAESLQFNFETIRAATDNFAEVKMLGRGGFGAVYKGKLPNGQEIAVKRLARNSGQGDLEFKNEVQIVAKLQHKNLVRLLGFCLEGEERLLIYEFMPNTSLDHFLFDSIKRAQLNWEMRYKIIVGVARGLVYLHEDSRLRIIHRDLKASNILLDANTNAKISDFGMAKLFPIDQTHADTRRIVGTYGYMAPEYAMHGFFSVKSDVYSFGVLVLEIVSGQKNSGISSGERIEDLITQVWRDWREGKALNMVDPTMLGGSRSEMMRCIHIGLLCVQENEADRPSMSSVVVMLSSHSLSLPLPLEPAYFLRSGISSATQSQDYSRITEAERSITNDEPITELHYR